MSNRTPQLRGSVEGYRPSSITKLSSIIEAEENAFHGRKEYTQSVYEKILQKDECYNSNKSPNKTSATKPKTTSHLNYPSQSTNSDENEVKIMKNLSNLCLNSNTRALSTKDSYTSIENLRNSCDYGSRGRFERDFANKENDPVTGSSRLLEKASILESKLKESEQKLEGAKDLLKKIKSQKMAVGMQFSREKEPPSTNTGMMKSGDRYDGIGPFSVSPRNRSEPKRKPVGSIANNAGYSESTTSFLKSNGIENLRKNNSQNYLGTTERSGFLESKGFLGEIRSDSPQKASSSKRLGFLRLEPFRRLVNNYPEFPIVVVSAVIP